MNTEHTPYWMYNIIITALNNDFNTLMKGSGKLKALKHVEHHYGVEEAKKYEEDIKSNRYTPLGAIWQTKLHFEKLRQDASDEIQNKDDHA